MLKAQLKLLGKLQIKIKINTSMNVLQQLIFLELIFL